MKRIVLTLVLFLITAPTVWADYQDGLDAYKRGDDATALREIRPLAEQGDARAMFLLGTMYATGRGVPKDHAESFKWYHKAAEQGQATAQYFLGIMYANGWGVRQNIGRAHVWFDLAWAQRIGSAKKNRDNLAKEMTPAQIADAQVMARKWRPRK